MLSNPKAYYGIGVCKFGQETTQNRFTVVRDYYNKGVQAELEVLPCFQPYQEHELKKTLLSLLSIDSQLEGPAPSNNNSSVQPITTVVSNPTSVKVGKFVKDIPNHLYRLTTHYVKVRY